MKYEIIRKQYVKQLLELVKIKTMSNMITYPFVEYPLSNSAKGEDCVILAGLSFCLSATRKNVWTAFHDISEKAGNDTRNNCLEMEVLNIRT